VIDGSGLRFNAAPWIDLAFGLRALAHASLGQANEAERDMAALTVRAPAHPEPLAYAELARGVLLEKGGPLERLGPHMIKNAWLVFGYVPVRERMIAHALLRAAYRDARRAGDAAAVAPSDADIVSAMELFPRLSGELAAGAAAAERARDAQRSRASSSRMAVPKVSGSKKDAALSAKSPPAAPKGPIASRRAPGRVRAAIVAAGLVLVATVYLKGRGPELRPTSPVAGPDAALHAPARSEAPPPRVNASRDLRAWG